MAEDQLKSWTEVEVDPSYRNLPLIMRNGIKERFFQEQVIPRYLKSQGLSDLSGDQYQALRKGFDEITRESPLKYGDTSQAILERDAGYLPNVDYHTGIDVKPLSQFYSADNDRERFLALSKTYGKANVGIDPGGRWYVRTPDKKFIAVLGINTLKNLEAGLVSDAPELAGMAIGSVITGPEVPAAMKAEPFIAKYGPKVGRFLGDQILKLKSLLNPAAERGAFEGTQKAIQFGVRNTIDRPISAFTKATPTAVGALGGTAAQEAAKSAQGLESKTLPDLARKAGADAIGAMLGDVFFRGMSGFGQKFLLDMYARSATTVEKEQAARALSEGFRPSVTQARFESGGGPLWRFAQGVYDMITSGKSKRNMANNRVINQRLDDFLAQIGITDPETVRDFKSRVFTKDFAIELAQSQTGAPVQAARQKIEQNIQGALDRAVASLDTEASRIMQESGAIAHPVLAQDLEKQITDARSQLSKLANTRYAAIWSMGGEDGITASSSPLKQTAQELWAQILKTADTADKKDELGRAVNTRLDAFKSQIERIMDMPDQVPLQQLAGLRSDFYKIADDPSLTPGVEKARFRDLGDSITKTLDDMASRPDLPGDVARELKATNKWYADEIGKFEAANVVRLARESGTTGALRAEDIPANIIRPGYESLIGDVKSVVGKEMWDKIAGTRFADLKRAAINPDTGKLDPAKLSRVLGEYTKDGFARKVWGDNIGRDIERLQKEAAVLADKIDPETLTPGTIRDSIQKAAIAKKVADRYWNENLMGELSAGGVRQERAITRIANMESLSDIKMIKAAYGETSPEFQRVQQMAMQKLLVDAIKITPYPGAAQFIDPSLSRSLAEIGKDKLDAMFGSDLTDDLFHLGDRIRYITNDKTGNVMAGALRAGTLMFHPLSHLPALAQTFIEGKLMKTPGFIRWITFGLDGDSRFTQLVSGMVKIASYEAGRELAKHLPEYREPQEYNTAAGGP